MRFAAGPVRRPRAIIRLALCCALIVALIDCSGGTSVSGQIPAENPATGQGSPSATAPAPTLSLSATPASVGSGVASRLSWSSTNATGCTAWGGWSGSEPTSGSAGTGALTATTSYALTCTGPGGSAIQSVTVNVSAVTAGGASCSASSGGLTVRAEAVRGAGVSPLLAFFDATATTSSAVTGSGTAFQDVSYSWNFGDTAASGTGTWAYGSNPGHNSKNAATGAVAAHLYITNGGDTSYPVTVTAYDGTSSASCQLAVTAYDASGAKGFAGNQTTCVYNSAPGSGCPAGAHTLQTYSITTALNAAFGSGKRVLFRCGDKFIGNYGIGAGVNKASIGAYGGCEGTSADRPVFQNSSGDTISFTPNKPTDIRIADIDFEDGTKTAQAIANGGGLGEVQITLYNLNCSGMAACFYMNQATQSGIIQSVVTGRSSGYATYWNYAGNQCQNGSRAANCGGTPTYYPVTYNAVLGNDFDGQGGTANNETFRLGACRFCVLANNDFKNSTQNWGATMKVQSGNPSEGTWIGQWGEFLEISDNLYTGTSGTVLVEIAPMNPQSDERQRYIVFERNFIRGTGASKMLFSAVNATARNNVFYVVNSNTYLSDFNMQISQRGIEPVPAALEIYNNTCYARTTQSGCIGFISGDGTNAAGINSRAVNNLFYNNGANAGTVTNNGTGNTVSNNTTNSSADPLVINASGSFAAMSDFRPTQNHSGGAQVPVWHDALGERWSPTWSLGALKPRAKTTAD
jgi:hypothetical protein